MRTGIRIPLLLLTANFIISISTRLLLNLSETHLATAAPPLGKNAALLHLFLRLHPHLPDAGDFRGRWLRVLESTASFLAGGVEKGGSLAAFEATVSAEAAAERRREGDGAAVACGAARAEYRFGDFHGRGGRETRGEANEELARGGGSRAATRASGAEMGSI